MTSKPSNRRLSDVLAALPPVSSFPAAAHMVLMEKHNEQSKAVPVKVLTRVEVARILGIAPKTLANWYSSGIGPPVVKLHGLVRYDEADFITWYQTMKTVA
ncbi:hypothetical protein GCM10009582_09400 [Arthrobacter flavus]|uniref:Helix-turn-helix transcriptional regulator n=1 Tax=Arthrobacter flavus TaxID=95172 RepID=A0ABW4Q6W7_9MICC